MTGRCSRACSQTGIGKRRRGFFKHALRKNKKSERRDMLEIEEEMKSCRLCPRKCGINRMEGKTGYCGAPSVVVAARAALHFWEEPCISGKTGSGTVFFSGCNLRCVYCQNHSIAEMERGKEISLERLSQIFLELQEQQANNINPGYTKPLCAADCQSTSKGKTAGASDSHRV